MLSRLQFVSLVALFATVGATTATAFNYSAPQTYPIEGVADSVAVGDIDGDLLDDVLVMTNPGVPTPRRGELWAFRQLPSGGFLPPESVVIVQGIGGETSIALVDLDLDGSAEIAVGHGSGLSLVDWQAGLVVTQLQPATGGATEIVAFDMNRDGLMDIVGLRAASTAHLFLADGAGSIGAALPIAVNSYGSGQLAVADMNGDAIPDLLVMEGSNSLARDLSVYRHDGGTGLLPKVSYDLGPGEIVNSIAAGDLTGDGLADVVLGRSWAATGSLWIFEQDPWGGLNSPASVPTQLDPRFPIVEDLNGDGSNDVLTLHRETAEIGYMLGTSVGDFSQTLQAGPLQPNNPGQEAAIGQLSGDDCADVAIIDRWYGLSVMLGENCYTPPQADLASTVQYSNGQLLVGAAHVSGSPVSDPLVYVSVSISFGVILNPPSGCIGGTLNGLDYEFKCPLEAMNEGESELLTFTLQGSTRFSLRVSSLIISELPDPNTKNNGAGLAIRG